MNPLNDSRERENESEISENESELNDTVTTMKTGGFSGYRAYDDNIYFNKKSFVIFASRTDTHRKKTSMDRGLDLLPNLTSYHFINLAHSIEDMPMDLDENYRHVDGFQGRATMKNFTELKFDESTKLEKTPVEEALRRETLEKIEKIQDIPRIKWNFSYDSITEEHLQNDYFKVLEGFQRMKKILLKSVEESQFEMATSESLNSLIISEFQNMDFNVVYTLLVATQGWYFERLRVRLVDRINQYMMAYMNQEINLVWLFAQEIWRYDSDFLNPFEGRKFVTVRGFFRRWLEISMIRFYMFPLDPMKMDNLTEKTLKNAFTRIFDNVVYPLQEANEVNYKKLDVSERYYTKLKTIDRLTQMKDELDFEFRKMKKELENIFLRTRAELVEYGRYFLEVYLEKTQEFFPVDDFLTPKNHINLERLYQVLSYFRMVPDDIKPTPKWIMHFPIREQTDSDDQNVEATQTEPIAPTFHSDFIALGQEKFEIDFNIFFDRSFYNNFLNFNPNEFF